MPLRTYVGPHDEVEIPGTDVVCKRDESVEVSEELAARLDEQTTWADPDAPDDDALDASAEDVDDSTTEEEDQA